MTETRWTLDAIAPPATPIAAPKSPQTASLTSKRKAGRHARVWWLAGAALLAISAAVAWRFTGTGEAAAFSMVSAAPMDIRRTITATGTLQAVNTVELGTQVSGTIAALYADYNSPVKQGQVVAQIDPSQVQAQLDQANASYNSSLAQLQSAQNGVLASESNVLSSEANLKRITISMEQARQSLELTKSMIAQGVTAKNDLIAVQSAYDQAVAQVEQAKAQLNQTKAQAASSRAQLEQAKAQLQQAKAQVDNATVNLARTTITSPIDGVVVARNVNVGQTVAASLQAPTLFALAQDLTKMQVLANIDEADVGQLRNGAKVNFTVDAYPDLRFNGEISQIRLAPTVTQNVVTYIAVVDVANPDLKLYPGMTANIEVVTAERTNVLAVPNGTLRFKPADSGASSATVKAAAPAAGTNPARNGGGRPALKEGESVGTVHKVTDQGLVPVRVVLGLSDGVHTEIVRGDVQAGDQLAAAGASAAGQRQQAATASPFAPQPARGTLRR